MSRGALVAGALLVALALPATAVAAEAAKSAVAAKATVAATVADAECELKGQSVRLTSPRVDVVFRPQPAPVRIGQHFALDILVCPRSGVTSPASLKVDASMPEHRHGMNYQPSVQQLPSSSRVARYRAEGLMFHMAGRWELVIEVRAGGYGDRLTHSIRIE